VAANSRRIWGKQLVALLGLPLVGGLLVLGCGEKEPPLTIPPFSQPPTTIRVDDVLPLPVILNRTANQPVTVQIIVEQALANTISLNTSSLTYAPGEQEKTVDITGRADSNGQFATIVFTIVENDFSQIFKLKVDP
jgi:hypothetical protein